MAFGGCRPQARGGEIGPLRRGGGDELAHLLVELLGRPDLRQVADLERSVRRDADGGRERSAQRLHPPLDGEVVQLGPRQHGPRLQDVRNRRHPGVVPRLGGLERGPQLLHRRRRGLEARLRLEVRVVGDLHPQDEVLDRGAVGPVGGEQEVARLVQVAAAAAEVDQQVVQVDRCAVDVLERREAAALGRGLDARRVRLEFEVRVVGRALDPDLLRGRDRVLPGGARLGIHAQRDVEDLRQRQRVAALEPRRDGDRSASRRRGRGRKIGWPRGAGRDRARFRRAPGGRWTGSRDQERQDGVPEERFMATGSTHAGGSEDRCACSRRFDERRGASTGRVGFDPDREDTTDRGRGPARAISRSSIAGPMLQFARRVRATTGGSGVGFGFDSRSGDRPQA